MALIVNSEYIPLQVFVLQDNLEAKDYELEKLRDELRRAKEKLSQKEAMPEKEEEEEAPVKEDAAVDVDAAVEKEAAVAEEERVNEEEINCTDERKDDEMDTAEVDIET